MDYNEQLQLISLPPDDFAQGIANMITVVMKAREDELEDKAEGEGEEDPSFGTGMAYGSSTGGAATPDDVLVSYTED